MPIKYRKVSSGADKHPYLKNDFQWPDKENKEKTLGPITDKAIEQNIERYKRMRTFNIPDWFIKEINIDGLSKHQKTIIPKTIINGNIKLISFMGTEAIQRFNGLKGDEIILTSNGDSSYTAETLWIRVK